VTAGGAAPAVAAPLASAESAAWSRAVADVTVVVSSHNRVGFLGGLIDALAAQREVSAEVVIVDNGSTDGTWQLLVEACAATSLALNALRVEFHDGPAVPRNTAVSIARAPLIAFTDDDCLPTPTWLAELTAQFDADTVIVQGQTLPEPGGWAGPWGRSLKVTGPTGLYETANLGVRRDALLAVGGATACCPGGRSARTSCSEPLSRVPAGSGSPWTRSCTTGCSPRRIATSSGNVAGSPDSRSCSGTCRNCDGCASCMPSSASGGQSPTSVCSGSRPASSCPSHCGTRSGCSRCSPRCRGCASRGERPGNIPESPGRCGRSS
jgi:hypothetical protein